MIAAPRNMPTVIDADHRRGDDVRRERDKRDVTVVDHQSDDRQCPAERLPLGYEFNVIRIALDPFYRLLIHLSVLPE